MRAAARSTRSPHSSRSLLARWRWASESSCAARRSARRDSCRRPSASARRPDDAALTPSKLAGAHAMASAEEAVEVADVLVSAFERDLEDGDVGFGQAGGGVSEARVVDEVGGRLPE